MVCMYVCNSIFIKYTRCNFIGEIFNTNHCRFNYFDNVSKDRYFSLFKFKRKYVRSEMEITLEQIKIEDLMGMFGNNITTHSQSELRSS